jgi:excisionase family DNA binding protein
MNVNQRDKSHNPRRPMIPVIGYHFEFIDDAPNLFDLNRSHENLMTEQQNHSDAGHVEPKIHPTPKEKHKYEFLNNRPKIEPTYIDIHQVSDITGYQVSWIYRLTSARKIPHCKMGNKLRFKESEINEWIELGRKVRTLSEDVVDETLRGIGRLRTQTSL